MALSASTDFSVDRDTLIKDSMRLAGIIGTGETPTAAEITDSSRTLNMMLKAWMVDGLKVWLRKTQSITLTAAKASYTLGPSGADVTMPRPERILFISLEDSSGEEILLFPMTREEYESLGNKTSSGQSSQFHYHPSITSGTLYLWPVPDSTTASTYTAELVYHKPIDDLDASTDDIEIPPHWMEAAKYGLAKRLAPEYGVSIDERRLLFRDAQAAYELAISNVDEESVYFQPEIR